MGSAGYTRTGKPHPEAKEREKGCAGDRGTDRRYGPAQRDGLHRVRGERRLVVPPAPVRPMRAHRLLRLLTGPAREPSCSRFRAPGDPEFRAGRVMVLELRREPDVRQRPGPGTAGASPARAAGARPGRPGTPRLAVPPALALPPAPCCVSRPGGMR